MSSRIQNENEQIEQSAGDENIDNATKCPQNKNRGLIEVTQLIDLTDEPISLTRQNEASRSSVQMVASNCICCCCDRSMTFITTDKSYVVEEIPIENIKAAQASPNLRYIALANDEELAVTDMIENIPRQAPRSRNNCADRAGKSTRRLVDLDAVGLTMRDILFWRWIDEVTLALVSFETLYIAQVEKSAIKPPTRQEPEQLLSLERVCDLHPDLASSSQVTDVQRDASTNLYAITGIARSKWSRQRVQSQYIRYIHKLVPSLNFGKTCDSGSSNLKSSLKSNSKSVPGRLSMLNGEEQRGTTTKFANFSSIESLRRISSQKLCQLDSILKNSHSQAKIRHDDDEDDRLIETRGYTQIHCKLRDRSQLISAHATAFITSNISFSSSAISSDNSSNDSSALRTTLIAANRIGNILKIYFIGMATTADLTTSGQNTARSIDFDRYFNNDMDFPIKVLCTEFSPDDNESQVAMILTKYGYLIVCGIKQSSILLMIQVTHDIYSDAVLEERSRGMMIVCTNGRVLLVRLNENEMHQLLSRNRGSRRERVSHCLSESNMDEFYSDNGSTFGFNDEAYRSLDRRQKKTSSIDSESTDQGIEILISTKL